MGAWSLPTIDPPQGGLYLAIAYMAALSKTRKLLVSAALR